MNHERQGSVGGRGLWEAGVCGRQGWYLAGREELSGPT